MNRLARLALPCLLAAVAGCATVSPPATTDDKKQALAEFIGAYRLAQAWPQAAPKIARDSLPRLEQATHADLDADNAAEPAHARVPALLPEGRRELEAALKRLDADEFARYTAYEIYAKYFDTAEIRQINAFYDSPTGRKLSDLGPTIVAESRKPQPGNVMARHFDEKELAEIDAFWNSPTGQKMHATAEQIREDMHEHFMERSEAAVQAVARELASKAEAGATSAAN